METYALCDMCRLVTVTAMKSAEGFEHYTDVREVILHADKCRLCSLMLAALRSDRSNIAKLKRTIETSLFASDFNASDSNDSDSSWLVRLWLGDLTEWKFSIEVEGDDDSCCHPELGFVIVVVTCFLGSFPKDPDTWKKAENGENVMHGTIEVCDQMVLPSMNSPKRLEASSSSDLSFSILKDWVEECIASHDKCKMISMGISAGFLPPRLIDVGPNDGSRQPFLCIVSEDLEGGQHDSRYAALSYCWGDRGTVRTTNSNICERRKEIALNDFPGTIRDAVLITRRLGIQYLWVDALCILQGRDEKAQKDWQKHSSIMGDIYGNAFITLGAAAAIHAETGIFHDRKLPRYCRIPLATNNRTECIDLCSTENREYDKALDHHQKQPLYNRSWAFQEKALSRRFLAYQIGQMYWRCSEGTFLEDGTVVSRYADTLSAYSTETYTSSTWQRFVEAYSVTEATYEKDKLPALSGLAQTIHQLSKDEYLAGLWKKTILPGLMWKTRDPSRAHRPSHYRAPSWSWAALNGEVRWFSPLEADPYDDDRWKFEVQYLAYFNDSNIIISGSNPFGEVACGYISIRGTLKRVDESELRKFDNAKNRIKTFRIFPDTANSLTEPSTGNTSIQAAGSGFFMLPIREDYLGCFGLVLRSNNNNKLSYRRVGSFLISSWKRDGSSWWFDACAEQTINIE